MRPHQAGTTLIELMIGLVLSSVVIAGVSSLFLQTQKVNRTQKANNDMTDDGRYALDVFQKEVRRAGGLRNKLEANGGETTVFFNETVTPVIPGSSVSLPLAVGEYIRGYSSNPVPANDAFVIRYQLIDAEDLGFNSPSSSASACTSSSLLDEDEDPTVDRHVIKIYFFVEGEDLDCTSQRYVNDICTKNCNFSDTPATLVSHVQNLTVRLGVDSDNPRDRIANYYVNALSLQSNDSLFWQNITSIRIALVLKSEQNNLAPKNQSYSVDGISITSSDHSLYRTFSTTIALRNQI